MTSVSLRPFHLAVPVDDLAAAKSFYCDLLGCSTGRTARNWIDLDFFGHQVTLHLVRAQPGADGANAVDGDDVPVRHFGIVLDMNDWQSLAERLQAADCQFLVRPRTRFKGQVGEQSTMFLCDPAGNALEFKSFADITQLFAPAENTVQA